MPKRSDAAKKATKKRPTKNIDRKKFEVFCHDLRTPLAIIKMNIDLFKISPEYRTVSRQTQKLLRTIEKQLQALILLIQKNVS